MGAPDVNDRDFRLNSESPAPTTSAPTSVPTEYSEHPSAKKAVLKDEKESSSDEESVPAWAIALIVVGALVILGLCIGIVYLQQRVKRGQFAMTDDGKL